MKEKTLSILLAWGSTPTHTKIKYIIPYLFTLLILVFQDLLAVLHLFCIRCLCSPQPPPLQKSYLCLKIRTTFCTLSPQKNRQKRHRQSKQKKPPKICRGYFRTKPGIGSCEDFFCRDVSREISQLFEASLPWMPLSDLEKVSTWWIWTRISSGFMGDRNSAVESKGCLRNNLNLVASIRWFCGCSTMVDLVQAKHQGHQGDMYMYIYI